MMDNAVKERLVGAAILVLLVVIVAPALLTGPRGTQPAAVPSEGEAAAPVAGPGDVRVVEIDLTGSRPASTTEPVGDPSPAADAAPVTEPAMNPPQAPAEAPAQPVAAGPAAEPAEPAEVATRSLPPAAPAGAAWAVQVAALANPEAAGKLVSDLKARGYPAFVLEHRADGRVLYRVRVGPEAQRERAEALAARLQGEGLAATVVSHP